MDRRGNYWETLRKLSPEQVRFVRSAEGRLRSVYSLCKEYGVTPPVIKKVRAFETYRHLMTDEEKKLHPRGGPCGDRDHDDYTPRMPGCTLTYANGMVVRDGKVIKEAGP